MKEKRNGVGGDATGATLERMDGFAALAHREQMHLQVRRHREENGITVGGAWVGTGHGTIPWAMTEVDWVGRLVEALKMLDLERVTVAVEGGAGGGGEADVSVGDEAWEGVPLGGFAPSVLKMGLSPRETRRLMALRLWRNGLRCDLPEKEIPLWVGGAEYLLTGMEGWMWQAGMVAKRFAPGFLDHGRRHVYSGSERDAWMVDGCFPDLSHNGTVAMVLDRMSTLWGHRLYVHQEVHAGLQMFWMEAQRDEGGLLQRRVLCSQDEGWDRIGEMLLKGWLELGRRRRLG